AHAPVIALPMLLHDGMKVVADLRDLASTKVFVAAMIVQPEYGREPSPGAGRLEEVRLGRGAVGGLPGQVLDVQPVVDELMLDLGFGDPSAVRLKQARFEPLPRLGSPGIEVSGLEPGVAKREPSWPLTHQARGPRAIGADHTWIHLEYPSGL